MPDEAIRMGLVSSAVYAKLCITLASAGCRASRWPLSVKAGPVNPRSGTACGRSE
jgi:hypothetical protein